MLQHVLPSCVETEAIGAGAIVGTIAGADRCMALRHHQAVVGCC